jgi:hypothetical protein
MFIPTRSNSRARAQGYSVNSDNADYFTPEKRHRHHRSMNKHSHEQHKGIPPAVAALLAVTTIQRTPKRTSGSGSKRKASLEIYVESSSPESITGTLGTLLVVDEQVEDSGMIFGSYNDNELVSFSRSNSSTALSLLLSPPDEFDDKDFCSSSVHSSSSESLPGLEADDGSSTHSFEGISPKIAAPRPKARAVSSETCPLDHPLVFVKEDIFELPAQSLGSTKVNNSSIEKQGFRKVLSFKSNLTAVLKSAAKSLSSFAPIIQPDDLLTRSILSNNPRYADERCPPRLAQSQEFPTPALRRYLNPGPTAGLMESSTTHCTGAIQMQTYHRSRRSSSSRSKSRQAAAAKEAAQHPPLRTDEGDVPRPREPRENSDFLRVIVLEMNMRRQGKLADTAQGKARLVLPPRRQPSKRAAAAGPRRIGDISARW